MSKTGSTYSRYQGRNRCVNEANTGGGEVDEGEMDAELNDFEDAMNQVFWRDGAAAMEADIDMGGFTLINTSTLINPVEHLFTPVLQDNSGFGTFTATTEYGYALETGDLVNFIIVLDGNWDGAQVGPLSITGLPLSINSNSDDIPVNIHHTDMSTESIIEANISSSGNRIDLYEPGANGGRTTLTGNDTVNNSTSVQISGFYIKT